MSSLAKKLDKTGALKDEYTLTLLEILSQGVRVRVRLRLVTSDRKLTSLATRLIMPLVFAN